MESSTIADVVASARAPVHIKFGEKEILALPEGWKTEDISKFLTPPGRIQQRLTLLTVPSFLEYVNRYAEDSTTVFAHETRGQYEAVIDYHDEADGRRECAHVAHYTCPPSEQWNAWIKSNGAWLGQVEFAQFLETNLKEIVKPSGAELMQVALQLQIHKSAEFQSEVRLDNGQQRFRYEESIKGSVKAGEIEIPQSFTISIPVFVDGAKHTIEARFRYRMNEGKLTLGYELIRPTEVWNEAIKAVTSEIRTGAKDVKVYVGHRA